MGEMGRSRCVGVSLCRFVVLGENHCMMALSLEGFIVRGRAFLWWDVVGFALWVSLLGDFEGGCCFVGVLVRDGGVVGFRRLASAVVVGY